MAGLLCAVAMIGATPLPTAWRHWRYSRSIDLPTVDSTRLVALSVPHDVYGRASSFLADLRVIDNSGAEVPYALSTRDEFAEFTPPYVPHILENSFSPGNYTQVVLDLGRYSAFHSSVRIGSPETEFMEWIEIDASDDALVWRIVQERAPIFRFSREGHAGTNVVHYSPNNARYLRVRVLDGGKRFPIQSAQILKNPATKPEREPLEAEFVAAKLEPPGQTAWTVDLGSDNAPLREVRFNVGPGQFVREVAIQTSRDGSQWFGVSSGEIFRFTQGNTNCEQLSVAIPGIRSRYLRVEIANGNDKPLPDVTPSLYIAGQRIVFEQAAGRSYRLIYGETRAQKPQYDLARRVSRQQTDAALVAQAGPEQVNSDWIDPRPWTETHDFIVWLGAGFAALLLGFTAIQSLRRSADRHQPTNLRKGESCTRPSR